MHDRSDSRTDRERFNDMLFVIDKHSGPTSFDVVEAFRRATGLRKVGHTGTLDPVARGILLLCTGRATRAVEHFMDLPKVYEFAVRLGVGTTTLDAEGEVVEEVACPDISEERIKEVARTFVGAYEMEPPAYSALKRNGKRMYELARAGEQPEVESREVMIHDFEVLGVKLPEIECRVRCSRGTYVRSLARDVGARLEVPAHLSWLVRTAIGPFGLDRAFPAPRLFDRDVEGMRGTELSDALEFLPGVVLTPGATRALGDGTCPTERDVLDVIGRLEGQRHVRILDRNHKLVAVGTRPEVVKNARLMWIESYRLFVDRESLIR